MDGDADEYPGMPRWVKAFVAVSIPLVLLVVIVFVTGLGADHGTGGRAPADDSGRGDSGDGNHTRPDGHHGGGGGADDGTPPRDAHPPSGGFRGLTPR